MKNKKNIFGVQFSVSFGKVEENLLKVESVLEEATVTDGIVILPEMWTSGFDYGHLGKIAGKSKKVLEKLSGIAIQRRIFIIGSMPEASNGKVYNTSFVISNRGKISGKYRKVHLFSPMREDRYFKRGSSPVIFNTPFGKIAPILCFDLRFPEFIRSLAIGGAEILVVSAQWPLVRVEHWKTLLLARAIENQFYVAGAAACGRIGNFTFCGNSMIIAPDGKILANADLKEEVISSVIDMKKINKIRKDMPCFQSRVPEAYKV